MASPLLQLFFAAAFAAAPITLYVPPVRRLNLFVETMEDFAREIPGYRRRALELIRAGLHGIGSVLLRILS